MSRNGYTRLSDQLAYEEYESIEADRPTHKKQKPKTQRGAGEKSSLIGPNTSKNVYVFPDGTISDHEDETIELDSLSQRNRGASNRSYNATRSSQHDDVIIREIPLKKTDTLHSISIKFRCPVSEIKKINGFYTDQEFYGFTSLKIPVQSHQRILQEMLEQAARERVSAEDDLVTSTKVKSPADIVSSEVSEEEDSLLSDEGKAQSLAAMMQLRTDPEDEEAYSLLDRQPHHNQHSNSSRREKRKFNKMIHKTDEELREIAEKVQQQTGENEVVTSMRVEAEQLPTYRRKDNCLSTLSLSLPCVGIICLVLFAAFIGSIVYYVIIPHYGK